MHVVFRSRGFGGARHCRHSHMCVCPRQSQRTEWRLQVQGAEPELELELEPEPELELVPELLFGTKHAKTPTTKTTKWTTASS